LAHRARFHMRRVAAMIGLGQAEGGTALPLEPAENELLLLLVARRELFEHLDEGEVADDAVLVLEVIVETETLCREMLADHRHPQVRAVLATIFLRCREAPVARGVGLPRRHPEQVFPFLARQPLIVPVGARVFAAVIEEADIVAFEFERPDLGLDEAIELIEIRLQVGGHRKVHHLSPCFLNRATQRAPRPAAHIWGCRPRICRVHYGAASRAGPARRASCLQTTGLPPAPCPRPALPPPSRAARYRARSSRPPPRTWHGLAIRA